jgi:hypothetical protein
MQRPSMLKRQKERQRMERREEKTAVREVRKQQKKDRAAHSEMTGEDPDLAGIVAGPQPPIE